MGKVEPHDGTTQQHDRSQARPDPRRGGADCQLSDRKLSQRWGIDPSTLKRRRRKKKAPPPDVVVNGRPYTWLSTIQRYEIELARQGRTAA